jgi:hypothetical protein
LLVWAGRFFSDDGLDIALKLDAMRASGAVYQLSFAGQFRLVRIEMFSWMIRRLPVWVDYSISCIVVSNPALGALGGPVSTVTSLVAADLAAAAGL